MSEKPYHLLPSRTQRKLYKALFRIRLAGYRHMHKAEARASDGLSNKERLALIGVVPDGDQVSSGVYSRAAPSLIQPHPPGSPPVGLHRR